MTTLTFNLDDEVTGSVTGCDEMDDIEICAEVTVDGDCVGTIDWTHTPEILDEVTIRAQSDFDVSPSDLDGTDAERIQFAADMTAEVVHSLCAQTQRLSETLMEARRESAQAKADQRAAEKKLAAVWPAINKCLLELAPPAATEGWSARDAYMQANNMAGQKVRDALRFLGIGHNQSLADSESS